ncbi:MAG: GumC family protein [Xanthobacteraceae bacterium]
MQTGNSSGRAGIAQVIDEIDLGELGRAVWRRKRLIIGLTLLAAGLAFLAVNMVAPRYKSEARVLIETRENIFLRPEAERTTERQATVDQEAVTSQVQLILSRNLARKVIQELKLGELPEFDPVLRGGSVIRTILSLVGLVKDPMSQTPEERVLRSYFERLVAFPVEKSRVIAIEFESRDPELAARVVNAVAEGYLLLQPAAKLEQSRSAGQWLAGEIDRMRKNVADAEAKVETYRATTNLFIGNNNTMLSNQSLGDLNGQLAAARAQRADAESKARIIRDALKRGLRAEFSDILNSELLRRLSEQHVTLRAQLAEQSSTLLDQHPRIKELRAQIADLERQMRGEADRLARSFENDARLSGGRVEALSASLDQLKRQAASSNEQDVRLRALERDAKSQRDLLESYLAKYREATARDSIGAASPDARIISRGIVSTTPSWPKKLPTVLIAAFSMFTLSAGFVLTGQLLGGARGIVVPTSAASAEVEVVEALPAFRLRNLFAPRVPPPAPEHPAGTPGSALATSDSGDVAADIPIAPTPARPVPLVDSPRAIPGVPVEAVEGLARALGMAGESARRIAVVGERRNMGATLAAITLARALARQSRVVLVDLALDSPNLSVIASDPDAPGIAELVQGAVSFGQIITRDKYSRMHVITAGKAPVGGNAIMSSSRLSITLEALARSYDYVVVDAGALPDLSAERLAHLAPRAVLVANDIDGPVTEAARERLLAAGFPNVSVLANAPDGPEFDAGRRRAA